MIFEKVFTYITLRLRKTKFLRAFLKWLIPNHSYLLLYTRFSTSPIANTLVFYLHLRLSNLDNYYKGLCVTLVHLSSLTIEFLLRLHPSLIVLILFGLQDILFQFCYKKGFLLHKSYLRPKVE